MAKVAKYYWLKLQSDFFDSKRIKKLRRMAGGDTYTIIYLKLQLLAIKNDGVITWTGLEENIADELSLDIDEEPENIKVTLAYLISYGLAETSDNINFFFPYAVENTGSEGSSAQRMREHRERQKMSHCDTTVTPLLHNRDTEIEKEIEIEKDTEIEEYICPAPKVDAVLTILLNDKTEYPIFQKDIDEWKKLYPAVDILQECRKMKGWCDANPTKRKTSKGIRRFINNWLAREQDNSCRKKHSSKSSVFSSDASYDIDEYMQNSIGIKALRSEQEKNKI